ncbi:MAG: dihydrolipoyl dehydrogenase [Planctomycetaceae bacterium]|nr:dihydrolipoyl dehydrogenase [Planctomycetaceae bacterium]
MTSVLVIGGGPGGYVAAIRAAQLGGEVTLVEKENLGGTCLNVGCIPTKALLHAAELVEEAKHGADYGVSLEAKIDFGKIQTKKAAVVKQLVQGVTGLLAANKVTVLKGRACFTGPGKVVVEKNNGNEVSLKPDRIIIAAGSVPATPPIPGVEVKQCIDSTGALNLDTVPASMVVIGGGVIGVEMATAYAALRCRVTVVEMLDEILPLMDRELTKIVRAKMVKRGVQVFTSAKEMSVEDKGREAEVAIVEAGAEKRFQAEKVLIAVGRRSNTKGLGLDKAGIKSHRARIVVNAHQETSVPGVYAIGDCTGGCMLAHVASAQGEIAAENAMGHRAEYDGKTNPSCVYTNPEFSGVGMTEEQVKASGQEYIVGRFPLAANGRTLIMGGDGMVKIIAGKKYGDILGLHIVGPRATDLIAEGALAIGLEATLDEFIATIHAHPTIAEAIREAALAAEHRAIHIPQK